MGLVPALQLHHQVRTLGQKTTLSRAQQAHWTHEQVTDTNKPTLAQGYPLKPMTQCLHGFGWCLLVLVSWFEVPVMLGAWAERNGSLETNQS
jgi:hypothetical protein